jgi:cytochrome c
VVATGLMPGKPVQTSDAVSIGYSRIMNSDCKACHTVDKKSVGPSYTEIAERYGKTENALAILSKKIIDGGGGSWGTEHVMSAHPQLPYEDVAEMVKYILGISDPKNQKRVLPIKGSVSFNSHKDNEPRGVYTLSAKYTDGGANGVRPLSGSEVVRLRSAKMRPIDADAYVGIGRWRESFGNAKNKSYIVLNNVDLSGIKNITYEYGAKNTAGVIQIRLESLAGPVISTATFESTGGWDVRKKITEVLESPQSGRHHLYIILSSESKTAEDIIKLWTFEFGQ